LESYFIAQNTYSGCKKTCSSQFDDVNGVYIGYYPDDATKTCLCKFSISVTCSISLIFVYSNSRLQVNCLRLVHQVY
jgi:hypothetical protein